MGEGISGRTKSEVVEALRQRYRSATRAEKGLVLDELVRLAKCHRKHAIRLLLGEGRGTASPTRHSRRIYEEAVGQALTVIWEAADRICGKRLRAVMPEYIESLQRHGHLALDEQLRKKLMRVSAASIDRILAGVRSRARGGGKRSRRRKSYAKASVPVRTFADWKEPRPGYFEADFVAHDGGISSGAYVHSLVLTDVATGWTECVALVVREQSLVVQALEALRSALPIPLLGIDTDNDSAFMNATVIDHCSSHGVQLTRSRAYLKNDQAWIEQKNGAVVRHFVGYGRLTGVLATQMLQRLYQLTRLYVNFFQPSFKLREKTREGSRVKKVYFPPATPCERLLASMHVTLEAKRHLREQKGALDPLRLLHAVRELQATIAALAAKENSSEGASPASRSLSDFLSQLPHLWEQGEARKSCPAARTYRTRIDPFHPVWPELMEWLGNEPDLAATELFERLKSKYPGVYADGQLRTLQRRVQGWRYTIARELLGLGHGFTLQPTKTPLPAERGFEGSRPGTDSTTPGENGNIAE